MESFQSLDRSILEELQNMIKEVYPYVKVYLQADDMLNEG